MDSQKNDRVETAMQMLAEGIRNLADSAEWKRWLMMAAKLPNYSFSNQMLLLAQRPDATKVCGIKTWNCLGRTIRKGERALWILAPSFPAKDTKRVVEDADDGEQAERRPVYFRAVPVFAFEQTEGDPLPEPVKKLTGDASGDLFSRLSVFGIEHGCPVMVEPIAGGANGFYSPAEHRIAIREGLAPDQAAKTLAHELGHALLGHDLDEYREHRGDCELEAESVAFVVLSHFGVDSGNYSFAYAASWAGSDEAALKALKACAGRVQRTARTIISGIEDRYEAEETAA